ncbi:MAG: helix-turn-helix transcriptional regulator [Gammaproteobacteria bacterium]|nr:helix-turn-helix transcriptional regulator [Gammaproteobacteria bacterium]
MEINRKNLDQAISSRLKQARETAGYNSARQFSEKNNLPKTTYWQHENGKRSISASYVYEYARALGVTLNWLIAGEEVSVQA